MQLIQEPPAAEHAVATPAKPYTAPSREIWAWGVGALTSHLLIQTFAQASKIFTIGFGINAVILGWAMMLPRLVDAVVDPYLGHLSDNTHTRWGRRKPYLVIGAVLGSVFLCAMWWADPRWSERALLIYIGVLGTLCYLCYGLYTMAWTAVGYELTDDYNERSKVAAVGALFLAVVALNSAWIFRVALMPMFGATTVIDGKTVGDPVIGMRWLSAILSVVIIVAALVAAKFCKERFAHVNRTHTALLPALRTTLKNRPFVILLLIKVCQLFGERLSGGLLAFLAIYYVCNGDKTLGTSIEGIGGTIGTVWSFALLPLIKPISTKFGKRAAMILGASISLAAAGAQPFILNPQYPYLMLIPALVVSPLMLIANTIANAVVPDICDLDELQTGERREGLFTAVMGFMAKMEISLCTLLVGYMVAWSGLNLKLTGPQSADVLHRLYWIAIIPNIVFTLGAFVLTLMFPMTAKSADAVRTELDRRRHAKAALGVPTDAVAEADVLGDPRVD
ncbi:MAG: MFS transporter [Tepidisphaeraceae bacterium]